jgi:hypothetical protein
MKVNYVKQENGKWVYASREEKWYKVLFERITVLYWYYKNKLLAD